MPLKSQYNGGKNYDQCDYDPYAEYEQGLAVYEKASVIKGNPDMEYDDGSRVLILNSRYAAGNVSESILEFLRLVRNEKFPTRTALGGMTLKEGESVRQDKDKEAMYMLDTFEMYMQDYKEEGRAEGLAEGLAILKEGIGRAIIHMRSKGMSDDEIADNLGISVPEVKAVVL